MTFWTALAWLGLVGGIARLVLVEISVKDLKEATGNRFYYNMQIEASVVSTRRRCLLVVAVSVLYLIFG